FPVIISLHASVEVRSSEVILVPPHCFVVQCLTSSLTGTDVRNFYCGGVSFLTSVRNDDIGRGCRQVIIG
ncbi:MAG: hypothetical protein KQH63_21615, partial [Desulfobulbaceae bacterium]|nr:hypothetical protein [Desulfobulbaceae bacterium]